MAFLSTKEQRITSTTCQKELGPVTLSPEDASQGAMSNEGTIGSGDVDVNQTEAVMAGGPAVPAKAAGAAATVVAATGDDVRSDEVTGNSRHISFLQLSMLILWLCLTLCSMQSASATSLWMCS